MIGTLGSIATLVGLIAALGGAVAAVGAQRGRYPPTYAIAGSLVAAAALGSANLLLVAALVSRDFSIGYVAEVGSRSTPLLFTVASLWGAQAGSILFWSGLLAGVTALAGRTIARRSPANLPVMLAVLLALVAFFAAVVAGPANPWTRVSPTPPDGPGPNPLLGSHPLMAIHPPLLYLGFVVLSVPYALTVAALVTDRLDGRWLSLVRRWTLVAWTFLTLGLITGAWWSYAVLGWGGYWAWDPVENVALLPWLTATAFLHSSLVGPRGRMLLAWNVALVVASFVLTLVATVITRSGVLESVHAFTRSPIGPLFLVLLALVLVGTVGLLFVSAPASSVRAIGPRGRGFLLNNVLLVAIAATVLFGTVFPILAEAVAGTRVSVGAPYFERIVGPLATGLLVLVAIGPSLGRDDWIPARRRTLLAGAAAGLVVAAAVAVAGSPPEGVVGAAVGAFVVGQSVVYLATRARDARRVGGAGPSARSLGGLVSHAGVGILALALVASGTGRREASATLEPGQTATLLDRSVELVRVTTTPSEPPRVLAELSISGEDAGRLLVAPGLALFDQAAVALPAIVASPVADLYVTVLNVQPGGAGVTVRLGEHPFTSWLWPAGIVIAIGGVMAGWPARRGRPVADVDPQAVPAVAPPAGEPV